MVEGQRGGPGFAVFIFFYCGNCKGLDWLTMSAYLEVSTQAEGACLMTPSPLRLCASYSSGPGHQVVLGLCVLRNSSGILRDFKFVISLSPPPLHHFI